MVLQWALFMPGFADYKNMNHLRVKSKKRKRRGNLRKCSGFPCTCRGRVCHCAPAPPVQTLVPRVKWDNEPVINHCNYFAYFFWCVISLWKRTCLHLGLMGFIVLCKVIFSFCIFFSHTLSQVSHQNRILLWCLLVRDQWFFSLSWKTLFFLRYSRLPLLHNALLCSG